MCVCVCVCVCVYSIQRRRVCVYSIVFLNFYILCSYLTTVEYGFSLSLLFPVHTCAFSHEAMTFIHCSKPTCWGFSFERRIEYDFYKEGNLLRIPPFSNFTTAGSVIPLPPEPPPPLRLEFSETGATTVSIMMISSR